MCIFRPGGSYSRGRILALNESEVTVVSLDMPSDDGVFLSRDSLHRANDPLLGTMDLSYSIAHLKGYKVTKEATGVGKNGDLFGFENTFIL